MDSLFLKAIEAQQKNRSFAFATVIESSEKGTPCKTGAKMLVFEDGSLYGTIGGGRYEKVAQKASLKALKNLKPTLLSFKFNGRGGTPICGGQFKVFIEPFRAQNEVIICGAGHIALPLSILAKILNLKVTIIDNRKGFANTKRFPHVDQILTGNPAKKLGGLNLNPQSFVVIITHEHQYDFACLKQVLKSSAKYIGVIGSHIKRQKFFKELKKQRLGGIGFNRIKMPIGIDIGAQTPEEIAVSIMAEIIEILNMDRVGTEKFKLKTC